MEYHWNIKTPILEYFLCRFYPKMLIFSTFFEEIANFSKYNAFNFHFPRKSCIKLEFMPKNLQFYMFLSKSFYKSESPKKLWHKNNIKKITQGIFQFFFPNWGPRFWNKPRFWNTFTADQLVFQNRGFTVLNLTYFSKL